MVFIDETRIEVKAGTGGSGCVALLREKFVPRGGPDGGNGGSGGSVVLRADRSLRTLSDYRYKRHFKAKRGQHGMGSKRHGYAGQDLVLRVPVGTVVFDDEGHLLADLARDGESVAVARGGRGGRGNAALTSPRNPVPRFGELGEPGEERWVRLELRLLADVGVVGLPNAGKSSLLARVTAARPKVADYPFTTLAPNLGVVEMEQGRSFVMADIPGLIEGAHEGKGLGDRFLRHVRRSAVLLFLVDATADDPGADLAVTRREIERYDVDLAARDWLVAGNKIDLNPSEEVLQSLTAAGKAYGVSFFPVSAATGKGMKDLLNELIRLVDAASPEVKPGAKEEESLHYVYREPERFTVRRVGHGRFEVAGEQVVRMVVMTDMENEEALEFLERRLRRQGVEKELLAAGARAGDEISIGQRIFEFTPSPGTTDDESDDRSLEEA